ncbi:ABC transporter ATP-binding protein [Parenemella sanctibonifatiensis]|uniref:ABC transporter ATP-binding protein n=1 Tax=Parenemella sanctibonifatiensis TaxID=2016505 RepID=A0A255DXS6_9ACTN|nr:ABC transporter ATP-binding protein [Parenemella sanctibonifatiensis]
MATPITPLGVEARGWGWRHATRRTPAVADLDLSIQPGERVLLLGASGAGKSTLLAALAGVLGGPDEGHETGTLRVGGKSPDRLREDNSSGQVGLVLQDPQANTIMARLGDDVAFGCENLALPRDEIWARVHESLAAVGLRLPLDRSTTELSGGQRQRLALAGVLAMRPGLLLLDEPTANLDPAGAEQVRRSVAHVVAATGATLVVVEHRVDAWLPLVDRVVVLAPGAGVLADGRPDEVMATHGADLARAGVWVPGPAPALKRPPLTPGDDLLHTRALTVGRFRGAGWRRRTPVPAATDIDLTLHAGEATVITGPNGAGKSTLALTLAGLLPPLDGEFAAHPTLSHGVRAHPAEPHRWRSAELLTRIGTVFQQPAHQFVAATVREELAVGPRAAGHPDPGATAERLLATLRLDQVAGANPFTLSGGEQRRLSVATVLATAPAVLVLDEPTFGQDRTTWAELCQLIADLVAEGTSVVAVSHDPDVAAALGDQVLDLPAAHQPEAPQPDEPGAPA